MENKTREEVEKAADMTVQEFYSGFNLDFLTEEEKQTIYTATELYAKGKLRQSQPVENNSAVWVKASVLPEMIDRKATPKYVKHMKKRWKGDPYVAKAVAYYFPEHFKSVEWEDWDDYDEKDFPYTENDTEAGIVWLRPGWYSSVECDKCDGYWSAPLDVIEWLDENSGASQLPDERTIDSIRVQAAKDRHNLEEMTADRDYWKALAEKCIADHPRIVDGL